MNTPYNHRSLVERRAELLAELRLQELTPISISRAPQRAGYDFLVELPNQRGGVNLVAVELKATEQLAGSRLKLPLEKWNQWSLSNVPVLLLVVDSKSSRTFFAPAWESSRATVRQRTASIELSEFEGAALHQLRQELTR